MASNESLGGLVMRFGLARAVVGAVVASAFGSVLLGLGLGLGLVAPAAAQSAASVRFTDSAPTAMEGRGPVVVTVERTDLPVSRLLVHYRTQDGAAAAGSDYVHTAGTLVFEVGAPVGVVHRERPRRRGRRGDRARPAAPRDVVGDRRIDRA